MKRALVAAVLLLSTSGVATAGGFVGLGVGPAANINGVDTIDSGGRSLRLLGGYALGRISVEASITGQTLVFQDNIGGLFDAKELGLAGKYNFPLGSNFEVFGKAGLHKTWLSHQQEAVYNTAGAGLMLGAGFEYRLAVGPIKAGSLFVDYTHYASTLEGDVYKFEGAGVGMWMLGFTVGF